ncbi:MAG: hypothetical protein D3910_07350 [Candidatus Electrothrix sp. ATG2]|nr:hypothetical protein [Candidatus Electrothrix sp. ATG2]
MLCAANLPFMSRAISSHLTVGFERLAYHAVKKIMPDKAIVKLFGTAATTGYDAYTGNKFNKINSLASDLHARLSSDISQEYYSAHDTGDAGLDIAAWVPFDDGAGNQLLVLAQAGCTCNEKEMLDKQYESSSEKWCKKIIGISPISMMITPVCYRQVEGKWIKPADILSVFIDRIRVVNLLSEHPTNLKANDIPSFNKICDFGKNA